MKMSIDWHKENLRNYFISLKNKKKELDILLKEVTNMTNEVEHRIYQIEEAEKEGRTEFDRDKYRVKRS